MSPRLLTAGFLALVWLLLFAVVPSAIGAQSVDVIAKCIGYGFKAGTPEHADCVKQYISAAGGQMATPPPSAKPVAAVPPTQTVQSNPDLMIIAQREDQFWAQVIVTGDAQAFERYLTQYPSGHYADVARAALARRIAEATPPASAPVAARNADTVLKDCPACPTMIKVPAGEFVMGSSPSEAGRYSDEGPQHRVAVRSFSMGKTEVTQAQWRAVMGSNPSHFTSCGDDCPVEGVSWDEAQQFVVRLSSQTGHGYRLPSESEWEYACRAGSQQQYCGSDNVEDVAWFDSNSRATTHAVALKRPNAWGLYDMSGNVWEWTQDCWNANYNGAPTNGLAWAQGDCSRRVVRGGSWYFIPRYLRAAYRDWGPTADRYGNYGFRVARTD